MSDVFLWGFVATMVLTGLMAGSQLFGITRMDITFMIGTIFTPHRDSARMLGFLIHLVNGFIFAFVYYAIFNSLGHASWWLGSLMGLAHALVVLVVIMPLMPGMHPRMASDFEGPEPTPVLEPPGVLALNYGYRTPLVAVVAHVLYGLILGLMFPI